MRKTLLLLSVLLFVVTSGLFAQTQIPAKVARVGVFDTLCRDVHHNRLRESLREMGYIEGENLALVNNCKEESIGLKARAEDMVRLKPDVIVARSTPGIKAVQVATRTIPIVMIKFGDPVVNREAESFARPGGNITGVSGVREDYTVKMLEMLREAFPEISRVAFLMWHTAPFPKNTAAKAASLGINLQVESIHKLETLDEVFVAMLKQKIDGILLRGGSQFFRVRRHITKLAETSRLPAIYPSAKWTDAGGLMSYGPDNREMYHRAAYLVRRILNGARAGELPIERFTKGELVINLKTAERLGLKIPPETLMFADKVIR